MQMPMDTFGAREAKPWPLQNLCDREAIMSVSGVSTSDLLQTSVAQGAQTKFQQIQTQFQKLGQDLQSGNLTQAQSDFATLTQELPNRQQPSANATTAAGGATSPTSTLAKAFQTLGQDLQAGNLSAAQADFATIQQDVQKSRVSLRVTITTTTAAGSSPPTPCNRISVRSARPCNPEVLPPRNRLTRRFKPIFRNSSRI
jgi:outer membrane protein assembly factor BamD (BamD/ComL family)